MKKKLGIRALAAILAASVVMSASTGMVSAKNTGASVSATGDVSDTSAVGETTSRAAAKSAPSTVSVEGAALNGTKVPAGLTGDGTPDSPYQIGSLSDLLLMNRYINYENASAKQFVLTKDIDLSKVTFSHFTESDGIWSLVSAKASLSGNGNVRYVLNGNGHKLYGMNASLSKNVSTGAIFGYINENSVIENLTVESCTLRVNRDADGAFAVFAVQNAGAIRNCAVEDCVLDARLASVEKRSAGDNTLSGVSDKRIYVGHALGIADNAGKVMNFTVTGSDTNKGIFVKGGRRFVGVVAGQNRKDISDVTVSGVRVLSYGSEDADTSITGKGEVAAYVGGAVGRNDKSATLTSAAVTLGNAAILFGDSVGGVVGENAGTVEKATVTGTNATGASVSSASANLYGSAVFGAVVGTNSGDVRAAGAYDVGFCFAKGGAEGAYGGIAGANSGSVTNCVATGSVNLQNNSSAGVGGLVGRVQSGTTLLGNYAIVSASQQGANVGALVGKDGTPTYIGQNNYWTSTGSGLSVPAPGAGEGQNDLTAATPVIVLSRSTSGMTLGASALAWSWPGSSATAAADFTKSFSVDNRAIRVNKSANSVTLSCTDEGAVGALTYTVSVSVPAVSGGRKLSARVSVPVFVTASASSGAGASDKNPIVISSETQMRIMQYAPNAHYALKNDVTVGSDWTPVDFTGTFNGNGHTLRIAKPLFASVSGSRNGSVSTADWKDSVTNLNSGYIYNMTIVPTTCVSGSVFGSVQNATLRDVTYTVADTDDGFVALSEPKSGALIDTVSGNVYLSRCTVSVPIAVTTDASEGVSALVGYAAVTNLIAENCSTTSLLSLEKNLRNVGGLFGNIASVSGKAELTGCTATGCVYLPDAVSEVNAKIMIGAAADGVTASGCTYALTSGVAGSVAKDAAPFTDGITQLNPQSKAAVQGAEDARSMLELIDPELIDEAQVNGLSLDGGVYKLYTAQDMQDMATQLNTTATAARQAIYELQNDIDMNGAELKMSTGVTKAFLGTFRSAEGEKFTLSNFTVTNTTTASYTSATGLFCFANGATFQDIELADATVKNAGCGTAVLVGFADKSGTSTAGNASGCTFSNISITDCTVISTKNSTGTGGYTATASAQLGTLIGAIWSTSADTTSGGVTTYPYTIENITVSGCTVENRNWDSTWDYYGECANHFGGGSHSIGGLIGESRMTTGTLTIGDPNTAHSIVISNVTLNGYSFVAGVIGKAGGTTAPAASSSNGTITAGNYKGGIRIANVDVTDCTIAAGSGINQGGSCAGILACDTCGVGRTTIQNCKVSGTSITSNMDTSGVGTYYSGTAGIGAHVNGTIKDCEVSNCVITSATPGGIVSRPSRKNTTVCAYDSTTGHLETVATNADLLKIENCKVTNGTQIKAEGYENYAAGKYEAGGILSSARYANVLITGCSVGSSVHIYGDFTYAGGLIGAAYGAYPVEVRDCTTLATVEILGHESGGELTPIANSVAAGAVAYTTVSTNLLRIDHSLFGGALNNNEYFCSGVIGQYTTNTDCNNLVTNCTITAELQKTTAAITKTPNRAARIMAYYANTTFAPAGTGWMGQSQLAHVFTNNIVSSYPYSLEDTPCFGSSTASTAPVMNTTASLNDTNLIRKGCIEDVNMPNHQTQYTNDATTYPVPRYMHDSDSAFPISGINYTTISISNRINTATGDYANRLEFYTPADDASVKMYSGWMSTSNGDLEVLAEDNNAAATTPTSVKVLAKKNASDIGIKAKYSVVKSGSSGAYTYYTDPDTNGETVRIEVMVPIVCTTIPSLIQLGGAGTLANPWQIWTLEDLDTMRLLTLAPQGNNKYFMLMQDITIEASVFEDGGDFYNSGAFFAPILDTNGDPFKCVFLGAGHKISGLKIASSNTAAATGLFGETEGAEIRDLTLENATILGSGTAVGGLVGTADSTTFTNVTITGSTITASYANGSASSYAGALAAVATNCTAGGTTLAGVTVTNAYFTGGLYGNAHYTTYVDTQPDPEDPENSTVDVTVNDPTRNTISGTTITGLSVTSKPLASSGSYTTVSGTTASGKLDAAGGFAAEFAGTISGAFSSAAATYSYTDARDSSNPVNGSFTVPAVSVTGNTISGQASPAVNVSVTGANASAVVAFVDETLTDAATCSISDVTVGGTGTVSVTSSTDSGNAAAGGILGKVRKTDDSSAGTPVLTVKVDDCTVQSSVTVSGVHFAGGVLGNSGMQGGTLEITDCTSFATVSASHADGVVGAIAGRILRLLGVWVDHCVASGTLSAQSKIGGVIGKSDNATTINESDYSAKGGILTNIVYSAAMTAPSSSSPSCGMLFGEVALLGLPNDYAASPFVNIYYSSYNLDSKLFVEITENNVVTDSYVRLAGNERYADYRATLVDLQADFAHYNTEISDYDTQLTVKRAGLTIAGSDMRLWASASGDFWSFTCDTNVPFVLESVYSENKADRINFAFTDTNGDGTGTRNGVRLSVQNDGVGKAVFRYENGLKLGLDLIATDIQGQGTTADPYLIERISHLDAVRLFPNKHFILAADLDFSASATTTAHGETLTSDEKAWASGWAEWAQSLSASGSQFTGTLDGKYYPWSSGSGYNTSVTSDEMVVYTIKNLTVSTTKQVVNPDYDADDPQSQQYLTAQMTASDMTDITAVGLFPVLPAAATVQNLKFESCSFSTQVSGKNVGVLVGENYGTIQGIELDNGTYSGTSVTAVGTAASGLAHVGAIAGISYTKYTNSNPVPLLDCTVKNAAVTSAHCAGGIVGGGAYVVNGHVVNVTVTGKEQAGGIAGGTLYFADEVDADVQDGLTLRTDMQVGKFKDCLVEASTIQSENTSDSSSVGGILGIAESGYSDGNAANERYRTVTFDHCTVDADTTVKALAVLNADPNYDIQQNYAGGILGQLQAMYNGFEISNCASYASVYAYGRKAASYRTSASSLVGYVGASSNMVLYDSGAPTFKLINNVCSGKLYSTLYAGGVFGYCGLNAPVASKISGGEFACGNIISCGYQVLEDTSGSTVDSTNFGVFMGYCPTTAFVTDAGPATMTDNYYSSDVCAIGGTPIARFGNGSAVTACGSLYDVAARSSVNATAVSSSLLVQNYEYQEDPDTHDFVTNLKYDENNAAVYEDTVYAPRVLSEGSPLYPASLDLPVQFIYNTSMANGGYSASADFANPSSSVSVYTANTAQADVHTLSLQSISVEPVDSTFYNASRTTVSNAYHALMAISKDPETCYEEHSLVADLGYGLLVKIVIQTQSGSGTMDDPYIIPDEETFAHYFFGSYAQDPTNLYNTKYYKQTADLDFDEILKVIAHEEPYDELTETFNAFAPIGLETSSEAFTGGYNGGGHKITNFHYVQPLVSDAYAITNVGLFGYVTDVSGSNNYHLRNLHIELKETPLDSDNMAGADTASVSGGINTGALVGKYKSNITIENCSVVYGTVRSGDYASGVTLGTGETINVGGLVGWMNGTARLLNCFTSTNVRASAEGGYNSTTVYYYSCGGLVGYQRTGAYTDNTQLTAAYENCFCSSDVVGPYFVGGFVGKVHAASTKIKLQDCACTATVTGLFQVSTPNSNNPNGANGEYGASLVVGYTGGAGGVQAYDANTRYVQANNVLVAGMNTTGYSSIGSNLSSQRYPMLFGTATLFGETAGDDADVTSGNIYYDSSVIGRITVPNGTGSPDLMRTTNVLCDGSGDPISGSVPYTAVKTENLLKSDFSGLGDAFRPSDGVLYPVLKMSTQTSGGADTDAYFTAFSQFAALPMQADSREASDADVDRTYAGVVYPTTISKTLGAGAGAPALTIESSKFSAWSEDENGYTGAQANYDYLLSGNASGGDDRADMLTDLLFNRGTDSSNTATYGRTDALDEYHIIRNTYLTVKYTYTPQGGSLTTYTFTRNERNPFVRLTGTVGGMEIHRTIHIGLRGSAATSYVATERQLRAITVAEAENTKFYFAYKDTISYDTTHSKNIRICADIAFNPDAAKRSSFTPISGYKATTTGDSFEGAFGFDGSNCEIQNLYIGGRSYSGLFDSVTEGAPRINNLILRNPDISGSTYVGALVAYISTSQAVQITNCMVIGGKVGLSSAAGAHSKVGGLVGELSDYVSSGSYSREVEQIGVVGTQISNASETAAESAGLVFGSVHDAAITNVYAVGELDVNAADVGMLAGRCGDCNVNRVVTSGYVRNAKSDGYVGGVFGQLARSGSETVLRNAESTAFVSGVNVVGGIVGASTGDDSAGTSLYNTIDRVIFAGCVDGQVDASTKSIVGSSAATSVTNECYNGDLRFTPDASATAQTTLQIVRGTGTPGKSVLSDGFAQITDANDADYGKYKYTTATAGSYVYDTTGRYYPNPVSLVTKKAEYGQDTGHVVSDAYKTGLAFALARINFAYNGTSDGTVSQYDQITVTSPMHINVFSDVGTSKVAVGDTTVKKMYADTVKLEEYNTNNTSLGSAGNGNTAYLQDNGSYLTPYKWKKNVHTGVRATLNTVTTATDPATNETVKPVFAGVENLYRFLIVNVVRVVKIDYIINDPSGLLGAENNKSVLMLRSDDNGVKYASSAVTSKLQDSVTTNGGTYTVKFQNMLATDEYIYVDTMLPSGCKVSGISLTSDDDVTWDDTNKRIVVPGENDSTVPVTVEAVLTVSITADPSWGIRDMTGGIG